MCQHIDQYSCPNIAFTDECSAELGEKKKRLLQKLYTCPYRDRKDRNPRRVEGTCEWFTSHALFQDWKQSSKASLLWVSADPGCGKSVLARYLADEVLSSTNERTTCYFFFKDDFEDQKLTTSALCAVLRQLFAQQPNTLSDEIMATFEENGETSLTSFQDLWDMLLSAVASCRGGEGEIVCIFDALDECEESGRHRLIEAISDFYSSKTANTPVLKILITSRPYLDIKRGFSKLERRRGLTIHLSGETQEEADKIACEIDMVIKSRVNDTGSMLDLSQQEQDVLLEELTRVQNRTYLWVHLIFDDIKNSILNTPGNIRSMVRQLPKTVDDAYDKILSKSRDASLAKKLLSIIVAAKTPLSLREMALALAIRSVHRSFDDLELVPEARFKQDIRELCGLFVIVVDSKIYLLHQTAREFLVSPLSPGLPPAGVSSTSSQWRSQFDLEECNCILAEICMWRLSFSDFDSAGLRKVGERVPYIAMRTLLGYAAQYWGDHYREGAGKNRDWAIMVATKYYPPVVTTSSAWFTIYLALTQRGIPKKCTSLLVASYFGLSVVVELLIESDDANLETKDTHCRRPPLSWACLNNHGVVVQQLLEAGADVSVKDRFGKAPLHVAAENGHETVVEQLLDAGADPNTLDMHKRTPLHRATLEGYSVIVQRLLKAGADINTGDYHAAEVAHRSAKVNRVRRRRQHGGSDRQGASARKHAVS